MLISDIIEHKRDGRRLDGDAIARFVGGVTDGSVSDAQIAAFTMATCLNGMSADEAALLTREMASSGRILAWDSRALGGPVVDKHSTGGVGDKVSFLLAPGIAACGGFVPMVSGRGLGHTGGTLDKIDCIPGYQATPDMATLRKVVAEHGCAIVGQTADLAPADARIYAVRDVTGTVSSIPLITASILSKKIAAGNDYLVMDVKFGSGAFMQRIADAEALAQSLISTAAAAGLKTHALLNNMDEPHGTTEGHMLEMREVYEYLTEDVRETRLHQVTMGLAAEMLVITGLADDRDAALGAAEAALSSGRAAERFMQMVAALGGSFVFFDRFELYCDTAPVMIQVPSVEAGFLAAVDARAIGQALVAMGGGRQRSSDVIDKRVGFSDILPVGAAVNAARPQAHVHAADATQARAAIAAYQQASQISHKEPASEPVIKKVMTRVA